MEEEHKSAREHDRAIVSRRETTRRLWGTTESQKSLFPDFGAM